MKKYIIRQLTDKKSRVRAAKVIGLYCEKLNKGGHIEMGNESQWYVAYEHTEKRSGIVLFLHPDRCVSIEYAAIENEGQGQLKALIAFANKQFKEDIKAVSLDLDDTAIWKHLGFTHTGMLGFVPYLFSEPMVDIFKAEAEEQKPTEGINLHDFFAYMENMKANKSKITIINPIK